MLTRAQDYGYYAPVEDWIHGTPLPVRSGPARCVVKYEDVVYLAEMAAERRDWADGNPSSLDYMRMYPHNFSEYLGLVDPNSLVLKLADLRKIQEVAEYLDISWLDPDDNGGGLRYLGDVTSADWQDGMSTSTPIVGENAYNAWQNGRAPSRYSGEVAGCAELLSQCLTLYDYFNSIKRYMFSSSGVIKDSLLTTYSPGPRMYLTQVGWPKLINTDYDGSGGYYLSEVVKPWYMVERYRLPGKTEFTTFRQSCGAEDGDVYKLYVYEKWAKNRLNPAVLNIQQPTIYLKCTGRIQVYEYPDESSNNTLTYDSGSTIPVVVKIGTLGAPSDSDFNDYPYPVYYELPASIIMTPLTQIAYPALVAWASDNVPDFDMNSTSHRCIATVTFESILLDTGLITHNAIIPAAPA